MGWLDGDMAELIGDALVDAEMTKPATLTLVTPGTRSADRTAAGTNPTELNLAAEGLVQTYDARMIDGTIIKATDKRVLLFGSTIEAGAVPVPGCKITIEGATYRIISVERDPASATYDCQGRA